MSTAPTPPPKPTASASAAPSITDLMQLVTDETIRQQIQQQAVDQYAAQRCSLATGVTAPKIELQIRYGRAYGFNEIQSQEWIYLYPLKDGVYKPVLDYKGRAFLLKHAGYDWRPVEHTATKAEFVFYKQGELMMDGNLENPKPLTLCWTIEDAKTAGLVDRARTKPKQGEKQELDGTYDKFGKRMLFAKVIHDFGAMYAQEVSGVAMADHFDGPTMDEVVAVTEQMKMPEEVIKETINADFGK